MPLKKALLILLSTSIFACQQQTEHLVQMPPTGSTAPAAPVTSAASTVLRISPIISGYWLSSQYWKEVQRNRSPAKAFDHTPPGPSSIYIEPFTHQTDSVLIGVTYGLHEGGNRIILLRPERSDNALSLRPELGDDAGTVSELSYQISTTDTVLSLVRRDAKTNRILDKIPYRRALKPGVKTDLNEGVGYGINRSLIAGQYQGIDSMGQPVNARFLPDGTVTGLPFRKYMIQVDFTGPNPGDELIFDVYSEQQRSFSASFGRDTLHLYTIHEMTGVAPGETDTTELFSRGRLRYQLVRVRKP